MCEPILGELHARHPKTLSLAFTHRYISGIDANPQSFVLARFHYVRIYPGRFKVTEFNIYLYFFYVRQ